MRRLIIYFIAIIISFSCSSLDQPKNREIAFAKKFLRSQNFKNLGKKQLATNPKSFLKLKGLKPQKKYIITTLRKHPKWSVPGKYNKEAYILSNRVTVRATKKGFSYFSKENFHKVTKRRPRGDEFIFSDFMFLKSLKDTLIKNLPIRMQDDANFLSELEKKDYLLIYVQGDEETKKFYQEFIAHQENIQIIDSNPNELGFVGKIYLPVNFNKKKKATRYKAAVLWGGSGSRPPTSDAHDLVSRGHIVVTLRYFTYDQKDPNIAKGYISYGMDHIPLETFAKPIHFLTKRMGVLPKNITVMGESRGGESALLFTQYMADKLNIRKVIANRPLDHSLGNKATFDRGILDEGPAWTLDGLPVPHNFRKMPREKQLDPWAIEIAKKKGKLEYITLNEKKYAASSLRDVYETYLPKRGNINVANYKGSLYAITGLDDQLWPSAKAVKRLYRQRKDRQKDSYNIIKKAGHYRKGSNESTYAWTFQNFVFGEQIYYNGGTPEGNILYEIINQELIRQVVEDRPIKLPFKDWILSPR